ncbi:hypothetical protein ACFLW1_00985 [Chloroflexota bacterium]
MYCLVKTKSCRRCGGDMSLEADHDGRYLECIQCGNVVHIAPAVSQRRSRVLVSAPIPVPEESRGS